MKGIEVLAQEALKLLECENGREANVLLVNLYNQVKNNPSCLRTIENYSIVGKGFTLMLCNQLSDDIDTIQTMSSIAYLCLSKAIKKEPGNLNLYKDRLLVLNIGHNAFKYTVMLVLEEGIETFSNLMFESRADIQSRDVIWQMELADLKRHPAICLSFSLFRDREKFILDKVKRQFFFPATNVRMAINQGEEFHEKVFKYLQQRILVEEDVDF
jgi:hypothetical protein